MKNLSIFSKKPKPVKTISKIEFNNEKLLIDNEAIELKNIEAIQLNHELSRSDWNIVDVLIYMNLPNAESRYGFKEIKTVNFGTLDKTSWLGLVLMEQAKIKKLLIYQS